MTELSNRIISDPTNYEDDKRFGYIAYGLLFLVIIFSTYLHHLQPQVLQVPSNTDVSTWQNQPFEQTLIYERMTDAERQKLMIEGIPERDLLSQFLLDLIVILTSLLCYLHARRHYGFWMASCFLIGSFVFTGLEESMWILSGRYLGGSFTNPLGEVIYGSYWFTKGGFWFIETPIKACFGWFIIAYSCVLTAGMVFPKMNLTGRAAVGGLIAMGLDLWMDPVQTSPEIMGWIWPKGDFLLILGIPTYNFIAWFLLIFLFAIFWEKLPEMRNKWGQKKASIIFFSICISSTVGLYFFLLLFWFWIFGNVFAFMGVQQAIQIPMGW